MTGCIEHYTVVTSVLYDFLSFPLQL